MSVQFGKCNFDGRPIDPQEVQQVRPLLAPCGPDGEGGFSSGHVAIVFGAFHTTAEARREQQPYQDSSGAVITWDGRLDNRPELIGALSKEALREATDVEIVAAAYERWGSGAMPKLIGDWALSIWDPRECAVLLARDFLGTRPLHYVFENNCLTWCTILDPLVIFSRRRFDLDEEYLAGWLASAPRVELTPYVGIQTVPVASSLWFRASGVSKRTFWKFDPHRTTRYKQDGEYEDEFRSLFRRSVERRLRSSAPVVAELSGGMDSSSIVCMADRILSGRPDAARQLHTISYFDDSEPNWNERPYFTAVERQLRRTGYHIDVGGRNHALSLSRAEWGMTPSDSFQTDRCAVAFRDCLLAAGSRVLLSGLGGDEVTGGVPTPIPELADSLASGRFILFFRQLQRWALANRMTVLGLAIETCREFLPGRWGSTAPQPPSWLNPSFMARNTKAHQGYEPSLSLSAGRPSFQESQRTLARLRRHIGCMRTVREPLHEARYPFLDRDLLEFLYSIPREQLVRPRQRRSLLRRSLSGIVPATVLHRERKGYVSRAPAQWLREEAASLLHPGEELASADAGLVNAQALISALRNLQAGEAVPLVAMQRTIALEYWLRARGSGEGRETLTVPSGPACSCGRE